MTWMARFPTGFARGGGVRTLARLLVGRVRRRRPEEVVEFCVSRASRVSTRS
jgi:hypothetical protein